MRKRNRLFAWYGILIALLCMATAGRTSASEIVEVLPLTNRILMVHFQDGYVVHHKKGQKRTDEKVVAKPLDLEQAIKPTNYLLSSSDDPVYKVGRNPTHVSRKSKGTDFAWFVDRWENNHAVNDRPDHTKEHWFYLTLPYPLHSGQTYALTIGTLATNGQTWKWKVDFRTSRSEAVHVNLIGYVPAAPAKYAYVYHWAGEQGGVDLKPYAGKRFWLVDQANQLTVFEGKLVFRAPADQPETGQPHPTIPSRRRASRANSNTPRHATWTGKTRMRAWRTDLPSKQASKGRSMPGGGIRMRAIGTVMRRISGSRRSCCWRMR